MSEQSFADLGVSSAVEHALTERGFTAPFAIQKKVIGDVLGGRDVLAKSPTGSGKTLAFMVPTIDLIDAEAERPAALVLAPTRELATQIVEETRAVAHAKALKVTAVYGGVGLEKQAREARKSHIVVATPGRLEDLLRRRAFTLSNVKLLILDEADRMLDMGFRPAVDRIVNLCPRDRQTLFFSATLDGEAGKIAKLYTSDPVRHEHVAPAQKKPDIEHRFISVERDERVGRLIAELGDRWELNLVFVRTKRGADKLVKRLNATGVEAVAMHGDKSQRQRERALADFEGGRVTTLVATDVAARGIHVDGISKVINFDPPGQSEDYVHRTGRTGRAGERGIAVTFVGRDNFRELRQMTKELRLESEFQAAASNGRSAPPSDEARSERPRREKQQSRDDRPRREQRPERTASGDRPRGKSGESRNGQSRNGKPSSGDRSRNRAGESRNGQARDGRPGKPVASSNGGSGNGGGNSGSANGGSNSGSANGGGRHGGGKHGGSKSGVGKSGGPQSAGNPRGKGRRKPSPAASR